LIERLYENILKLADTPEIGYTREELTGDGPIFFWPVENYLILYRYKMPIEIIAIAHGKRDIPSFLRKRGFH
jgi:plasmid stabilization system protein ParE